MAKKEAGESEGTPTRTRKERKPSAARQTLLDAAEGKETVLRFDSSEVAKGAAYGWWGARRRAGLSEKVSVNLDTKAMTVTIGPRQQKGSDGADPAEGTFDTEGAQTGEGADEEDAEGPDGSPAETD